MKDPLYLGAVLAGIALMGSAPAFATVYSGTAGNLSFTSAIGGGPSSEANSFTSFQGLGASGGTTANGMAVSFSGLLPGSMMTGSTQYTLAPWMSGSNNVAFGGGMLSSQGSADPNEYVSSGIGSVTMKLPNASKYFGLLWGSVDSYNSLQFYSAGKLVGSLTGTDVQTNAGGFPGINGTVYLNVDSAVAFDEVVASSQWYAFEFTNVAFDPPASTAVPEPSSLIMLGSGLLGLALLLRARRT